MVQKQKVRSRLRLGRILRLSFLAVLITGTGSILFGTGIADAQAPQRPGACGAETLPGGSVALVTWFRANNGADGATNFIIERRRNSGTWYWAAKVGQQTEWRDTTRSPAYYEYRVKAQANGVNSTTRPCGGTVVGPDNGAPARPSSCTVTANANRAFSIKVIGLSASTDSVGIRNNGNVIRSEPLDFPQDQFFISRDRGSRQGTQHFSVRAVNASGASEYRYCGSVTFTPTTGVFPIRQCYGDRTPQGADQRLDITWSSDTREGTSTNADAYVIERRRVGTSTWWWRGKVSAEERLQFVDRLPYSPRFEYRIKSQRNGVNSAPRQCGIEGEGPF